MLLCVCDRAVEPPGDMTNYSVGYGGVRQGRIAKTSIFGINSWLYKWDVIVRLWWLKE
jgi:hypothetical protein